MQTDTPTLTDARAQRATRRNPRGVFQKVPGKNSPWWIRFTDSQGHLRREKAGTKSAAIALYRTQKQRALEGKKLPRNLRSVSMPTLRSFEERFIDAIKVLRSTKPQTIRFYSQQFAALLAFGPLADARLCDIDDALIEAFVEHRAATCTIATVNRGLATLRRALRLAQRWNVIDRVPQVRRLPGEHEREFVLSREKEAEYLAACVQPLRDAATLMLDTGLRVGEALALRWQDVQLSEEPGYVRVREGKSRHARRAVPLTPRLKAMLELRRKQARSLSVFAEDDRNAMLNTSLAHLHAKARVALGLPNDFVLHSLRHTFCTRLGEAGAEAFLIKRLAGHFSVTMSERYVHPTPESAVGAIAKLEAANRAFAERTSTTIDTSTLTLPASIA